MHKEEVIGAKFRLGALVKVSGCQRDQDLYDSKDMVLNNVDVQTEYDFTSTQIL